MNSSERITLNVGGKVFITSMNTLDKFPVLAGIIKNWNSEDEKTIYLDKDPKAFAWVLNIMREEVSFEDVPEEMQSRVISQLKYFCIDFEISTQKPDSNIKPYKINSTIPDLKFGISSRLPIRIINWNTRIPLEKGLNILGLRIHTHNSELILITCIDIKFIDDNAKIYPIKSIDLNYNETKSESITIPINLTLTSNVTMEINVKSNLYSISVDGYILLGP